MPLMPPIGILLSTEDPNSYLACVQIRVTSILYTSAMKRVKLNYLYHAETEKQMATTKGITATIDIKMPTILTMDAAGRILEQHGSILHHGYLELWCGNWHWRCCVPL